MIDYGSTDVLKINEVPRPTLKSKQILIDTKAIGINPFDWKLRSGMFKEMFPLPLPAILGFEVSGIVQEVASDVKDFKIGDRVYAKTEQGYAEQVVLEADQTHLIPEFLNFEQAAALPTNTQVAYNVLITLGQLKKNQNVLIHAGSGGVGIAAIQMAKHFGANVTTTVSSKNIDFVRSLGADHVIDYIQVPLEQVTQKFDLILDSLGGEAQIKSWDLLNENGLLVSLLSDESAHFSQPTHNRKFIFAVDVLENHSKEIHELIQAGHIQPVVDEIFQFTEMAQAHRKSELGHVKGKIIVQVK